MRRAGGVLAGIWLGFAEDEEGEAPSGVKCAAGTGAGAGAGMEARGMGMVLGRRGGRGRGGLRIGRGAGTGSRVIGGRLGAARVREGAV